MAPRIRATARTDPPFGPFHVAADAPRLFVRRFRGRGAAVVHGPHRHRFFELIFIERGAGTHRADAVAHAAHPGDVFVIPPGQVHDADGLDGAGHWIVAFEPGVLGHDRAEHGVFSALPDDLVLHCFLRPLDSEHRRFVRPDDLTAEWLRRLEALAAETDRRGLGSTEAARALLTLMLVDLARLAAPRSRALPDDVRPHLARAFRAMEAGFRGSLRLRDLARSVGLSPAYLTGLLKRETGRSAFEWVAERRVAEAQHLLRETTRSVKEIAHAVGYRDSSHFIRQFARLSGATPTAWRARHTAAREA